MLTRFRVSGFKNLQEVDLRFGPFTCIAGGNAVGKSNLFDAIMFLSALADAPVLEAAMAVRDKAGKSSDVRSLFHATNKGHVNRIGFQAEMIIPAHGVDDLGQKAEASITFLEYSLVIEFKNDQLTRPSLQIVKESLDYVSIRDAAKKFQFRHSAKWLKSVLKGRRTSPFISTDGSQVRLHQDGRAGRAREFLAATLPRTVLSTVNAVESPTAVLARREMQSWRLLQLEPSALRASDPFTAPTSIGSDGSHLPSTLYALSRQEEVAGAKRSAPDVLASVSGRLAELVDDVHSVTVERDDRRELFTVMVKTRDGTVHPARSLSDGTLRFLALSVLEADPQATGLLCLEEPENGIHPERVVAILRLLKDLAVDTSDSVGVENPLRQVIINTHSPTVVAQVPEDSVLFAARADITDGSERSSAVVFLPLSGTWRANSSPKLKAIQKGQVMQFLSPVRDVDGIEVDDRRVIDRPDLRQLSFLPVEDLAVSE
jgi:predicted ATPase